MGDTYSGVCKICNLETDLINGICGECTLRIDDKDKICKHLDGDECYCLMIKGKCPGKDGEYCSDYEGVEREERENE